LRVLQGKKWNFPCNRWFDSGEGDRQIERDLLVDGKPGPGMANYRITTVTGQLKGSGTDANVYITLVGQQGRLDKVKLDNDKNNFETGRIDVFNVEAVDLGELTSVTIQHDGTGIGSGWYLGYIFVSNETNKKRWMFACNRWLDKHEDDGKTERTLTAGASGTTIYQLKVMTGNVKDAGTDANVSAFNYRKKRKN